MEALDGSHQHCCLGAHNHHRYVHTHNQSNNKVILIVFSYISQILCDFTIKQLKILGFITLECVLFDTAWTSFYDIGLQDEFTLCVLEARNLTAVSFHWP